MQSLHSSVSSDTKRLRLAVLVSGGGTNLQAMLDRSRENTLDAEVVVVASDRNDAYGLVRARNAGVPAHVVSYGWQDGAEPAPVLPGGASCAVDLEELDRRQRIIFHPDRGKRLEKLEKLVRAEERLIALLDRYEPDYVCLAGYMRLLSPFFLDHCNRGGEYRVINIHPALLPSFPGGNGYEDTFGYGCKWGGVTVHFVDEGEDSGPIIAQAAYPIFPMDGIEEVRRRGLQLEYAVYSQCINWLARGQAQIRRPPGRRAHVFISDPSYPEILRGWVEMAL